MKENIPLFLKKLEALTRETGIAIDGCHKDGCPVLQIVNDFSENDGYMMNPIQFVQENSPANWEKNKDKIASKG